MRFIPHPWHLLRPNSNVCMKTVSSAEESTVDISRLVSCHQFTISGTITHRHKHDSESKPCVCS